MSKKEKIEKIIELIHAGELDKALELADVNDIERLSTIGLQFGQNKVYDIAERIFDLIIRLDPNSDKAWYNKGVALVHLGKHDEVIKCFDKARLSV